MDGNRLRQNFLRDGKCSRIRDDHRIRPGFSHCLKVLAKRVHRRLVRDHIGRHIELSSALMTIPDRFPELIGVQVLRLCAQSERLAADIDGVSTVADGGLYDLE